ncbi:MAG: Copper binding protein plastocyanin/azurin family [Planctomycetota bacterium]
MKILALSAALLCAAPAFAETIVVQQIGFFFSPREVVVNAGDTVRFVWTSGSHTVTEGTDGLVNGNEAFHSLLTSGVQSYSVTFSDAFLAANPRAGDRYEYFCAPHFTIQMKGAIQVARPAPGVATCFGTQALCPCGNGGPEQVGCRSSLLVGGRLRASGGASVGTDTLQLWVNGLPEGNNVTFIQGSSLLGAGAGLAFGDGLRCAGGTVVRLGVKPVSFGVARQPEAGESAVSLRGFVPPGSTRHYQAWYLDGAGACGGFSSNLTNAYTVSWLP